MKIKIIRPKTGTTILVDSPIELNGRKHLSPYLAMHLNNWVDYHFPGFEICDFVIVVD